MILISGCSLMCTEPTIWRPNSSPDVASLWDLQKRESWQGIGSFGGGGIGGADSMYDAFIVYSGGEIPWNNRVKTCTRLGLILVDQDATVELFRNDRYGFVSALQFHGGYNFLKPFLVGDGSLILGKILNPYTIGDEVPRPSSVLYLGYRRGWLKSYSEEYNKAGDGFSSILAGLEIWLGKFSIYVSAERLKPSHPEHSCWKDPKNEKSYILMSSGFKLLLRD